MGRATSTSRTRTVVLLGPLFALLLGLLVQACAGPKPAATPTASSEWVEETTQTASYSVKVRIGPAVALEAMQSGAIMTMVDQGRAVNHHLEVHIFQRSSGAEIKTLIPGVTIGQPATKLLRGLPNVEACLLANHRITEPHFGDNLYLSDGKYAVTVAVGGETVVVEDIVVKAP